MGSTGVLSEREMDILIEHVESPTVLRSLFNRHFYALHQKTMLRVMVATSDIQLAARRPSMYPLIPAKARLVDPSNHRNTIETECYVAYGNWSQVQTGPGSHIDIFEHLDKFVPQNRLEKIGLFTCQNGIQNGPADFYKMCTLVSEKIAKEKPLFIGLYNKTSGKGIGFMDDMSRMLNEWEQNSSPLFTRQLFYTISTLLPAINPNALWTHIAHSEGGLIANLCVNDTARCLSSDRQQWMKKRLITSIYGGVASIQDADVHTALNTYSNKDIALNLVSKHLDKLPMPKNLEHDNPLQKNRKELENHYPKEWVEQTIQAVERGKKIFYIQEDEYPYTSKKNDYTITIVKSALDRPPPVVGDHSFESKTYQMALKNHIDDFRNKRMVYDSQKMR